MRHSHGLALPERSRRVMKIGNLVHVVQELGCHTPPTLNDLGLGVILKIEEERFLRGAIRGDDISLGRSAVVKLASGETKTFHEKSLEVLS